MRHDRPALSHPTQHDLNGETMKQLDRSHCNMFAAVHKSESDAVDGSSAGTRVPSSWAPL